MVDEAPTDDTQTESTPMTTVKPKKKKRAKAAHETRHSVSAKAKRKAKSAANGVHGKVKKGKANGKPELNEVGLPIRSPFIHQMGVRLTDEERAKLIDRGRKEGHNSFSNIIRAALGFDTIR